MTHPIDCLAKLNRPRLLVRAARIGIAEFNRDRSLRRLLPGEHPPAPGHGFEALLAREAAMNDARREGGTAYSAARHVEVLTALICEARLADYRKAA